MEELQVQVLEGKAGAQVAYAFRYPATLSGRSPFDRYWRGVARQLARQAGREAGRFPTVFSGEWQETRRDGRFCSGFVDISRRIGHNDWTLWRVSATFSPKSPGPLSLGQLLGHDWQRPLQSLVLRRLEELSAGETPFFSTWRRQTARLLARGRYYLTPEGLCLWFPQETLAPKNAGLPTVLLPYDTLDIPDRLC